MLLDTLVQYDRPAAPGHTLRAGRIELVTVGVAHTELVLSVYVFYRNNRPAEYTVIQRPTASLTAHEGDFFVILDTGEEHVLSEAEFYRLTEGPASDTRSNMWDAAMDEYTSVDADYINKGWADAQRRAADYYGGEQHSEDVVDALRYAFPGTLYRVEAARNQPAKSDPAEDYVLFVHPSDANELQAEPTEELTAEERAALLRGTMSKLDAQRPFPHTEDLKAEHARFIAELTKEINDKHGKQ